MLKDIIHRNISSLQKKGSVMKKKTVLLILIAVLVMLCSWCFLPRSFHLVFAAPDQLTCIRGNATIASTSGGNLQVEVYELELTKADEGFNEIITLVASTKFRQDLRNLFPTLLNDYTTYGEDKSAIISLQWNTDINGPCTLTFSKNSVLVTPLNGSSSRVYHPIDHSILDKLIQRVQKYGTKK